MANCVNYNCDTLPAYDSSIGACGAKTRKGGASQIGLIECGFDLSDPSDATEVQQAIDDGNITLISGIKFGLDDPTPNTQDAITSCGSPVVIDYNQSATLEDFKVTNGNTDFYNTAKKRTYGGLLIFPCATSGLTDQVIWADAEIQMEAFLKFPNVSSQAQNYSAKFTWKSEDIPLSYNAPVLS